MDVSGGENKEQYCIGTWNVRSMNQSKLEVVKQEMARVSIGILEISELKWTGMGAHTHSRPTLCDPMDCSLPRSSVRGIFQARILMWIAIPSPGDLPNPGIKPKSLECPVLEGSFFTFSPPGLSGGKEGIFFGRMLCNPILKQRKCSQTVCIFRVEERMLPPG